MKKELICITCPNGCELSVELIEEKDGGKAVLSVSGASCPKGEAYARQEIECPKRSIATSVAVKNGALPLCSVRLSCPIEQSLIFKALAQIKAITLTAPVEAGEILIHGILGTDADVITTKSIPAKE